MAGNKIYVQGSYIDVHDNENVYLNVDKAEVDVEDQTSDEETSLLPEELATKQATKLLDAARKEGWLDEQYHPLLSRAKSAVLADHIAELLGIHQKS